MINKIEPTITIEGKQLEINELIADLQAMLNQGITHIALGEKQVYDNGGRYDHVKVLKGLTVVAKKVKKTKEVDWDPKKGWTGGKAVKI